MMKANEAILARLIANARRGDKESYAAILLAAIVGRLVVPGLVRW